MAAEKETTKKIDYEMRREHIDAAVKEGKIYERAKQFLRLAKVQQEDTPSLAVGLIVPPARGLIGSL